MDVQTQSMEALLSQLAETAAQERALLEECGDLLSVAASLEVDIDTEYFQLSRFLPVHIDRPPHAAIV